MRIFTISVPQRSKRNIPTPGVEVLQHELIKNPRAKQPDTFDLAYSTTKGRFIPEQALLGVFPVLPSGLNLRYARAHYLDVTPYYLQIPSAEQVITGTRFQEFFQEQGKYSSVLDNYNAKRHIEPLPKLRLGFETEARSAYLLAWINMTDGNPAKFDIGPDCVDQLKPKTIYRGYYYQVMPVFPSVYPGFYAQDTGYYSGIVERLSPEKGNEVLVVGPGIGADSYLVSRLTQNRVWAIGLNPLEIANSQATADAAGFELEAIVGDNIITSDGLARFDRKFNKVVWNMPFASTPEGVAKEKGELVLLEDFWDYDKDAVGLFRFLQGLPIVLEPNGAAFIWNVSNLENYLDLQHYNTGAIDYRSGEAIEYYLWSGFGRPYYFIKFGQNYLVTFGQQAETGISPTIAAPIADKQDKLASVEAVAEGSVEFRQWMKKYRAGPTSWKETSLGIKKRFVLILARAAGKTVGALVPYDFHQTFEGKNPSGLIWLYRRGPGISENDAVALIKRELGIKDTSVRRERITHPKWVERYRNDDEVARVAPGLLNREYSTYIRSGDRLESFRLEARKYRLLEPDEQAGLALLIQQGNIAAKEALVNSSMGIIISALTRKWLSVLIALNLDVVEAFACGKQGLERAAEYFDPLLGAFSTIAYWRVNEKISEFIDRQKRIREVSLEEPENPFGKLAIGDSDAMSCNEDGFDLVSLSDDFAEIRRVLRQAQIKPRDIELFLYRIFAAQTHKDAGKKFELTGTRVMQIIHWDILPVLRDYIAKGGDGLIEKIVKRIDEGGQWSKGSGLDNVVLAQTEAGLVCQIRDRSHTSLLGIAQTTGYYSVYRWASGLHWLFTPLAWSLKLIIAVIVVPIVEPLIFLRRHGGIHRFLDAHPEYKEEKKTKLCELAWNWFDGFYFALLRKNGVTFTWSKHYPRAVILHAWHNLCCLLGLKKGDPIAIADKQKEAAQIQAVAEGSIEFRKWLRARRCGKISWPGVTLAVKKRIALVLARELGKTAEELIPFDFFKKIPYFGNKSTSGLIGPYRLVPEINSDNDAVVVLKKDLGIEDVSVRRERITHPKWIERYRDDKEVARVAPGLFVREYCTDISSTDLLGSFRLEARKYRRLKSHEQAGLVPFIRQGNIAAKEALVNSSMGIVISELTQHWLGVLIALGLDINEAFSCGMQG
ncbi:MAG: hypothetical protein NTY47_07645, partial [Candidatus Omnitrophica bacterium]|nr:hypothetical protein [Candidatus Omnitrophota bacterium]